VCACLAAVAPELSAAPAQTVGSVAFLPPEGWKYEQGDHVAAMTTVQGDCQIRIYQTVQAGQDVASDFRSIWTAVTGTLVRMPPAPPGPRRFILRNGRQGVSGSGTIRMPNDGTAVVTVSLLDDAGGTRVPVLVAATSRAALEARLLAVRGVYESIAVVPRAAHRVGGPPPSRPPGQSLTVRDLAGEWRQGSGSRSPRERSPGGSFIVSQATYVLRPDGSYSAVSSVFSGGRVVTERQSGTFTLESKMLLLRSHENQVTGYRLLEWHRNGQETTMTLLPAQYSVTQGNIGLYSEQWTR
jgi:hypothetical protein